MPPADGIYHIGTHWITTMLPRFTADVSLNVFLYGNHFGTLTPVFLNLFGADAVDHCKDDRDTQVAYCLLCGSCFPLDSYELNL